MSGIIRAPNRFSPFRHYEQAIAERDTVLARMVKLEMVSAEEAQQAKREKIKVLDQQEVASQESYALDAVRRDLDDLLERDEVEDGGLQIQTHLDADLQALAEAALERGLPRSSDRLDTPTRRSHNTKRSSLRARRSAGRSRSTCRGRSS